MMAATPTHRTSSISSNGPSRTGSTDPAPWIIGYMSPIQSRTVMAISAIDAPATDPTPIFEHFRGSYGTELLTAAVAHFGIFARLAAGPVPAKQLAAEIQLAERPSVVLFTALKAMQLLEVDAAGRLSLSAIAKEHLVPGAPFYVGDYVGLAANAPGVIGMVERL